jgi:hypothetical protein
VYVVFQRFKSNASKTMQAKNTKETLRLDLASCNRNTFIVKPLTLFSNRELWDKVYATLLKFELRTNRFVPDIKTKENQINQLNML